MGVEIERKFLVRGEGWRDAVEASWPIRQGYLAAPEPLAASGARATVRVRRSGEQAFLTIKGPGQGAGLARAEFEYPIPPADADALLAELALPGMIEKVRHRVRHGAHGWELDVFAGENAGLVLAELELTHEDEPFERPDWLGEEVTQDGRYYNAALARHPFSRW
ncbi:MAG: CYTH domain-containing protein [Chromatiaceae bacterium]|nr:CYTH domain-containing protein [Chromatiaceae bacterium]